MVSGNIDWKSDRRVHFLKEIVNINSGTRNFSGVDQVQEVIAQKLRKLGFDIELRNQPEEFAQSGKSGKFLIAQLTPKGTHSTSFIDILTHADTVFEPESGFLNFELDHSKGTATGPGVIDDKGGIVVALTGIERFLNEHKRNLSKVPPIRFLCGPNEEIGSPGFIPLLQGLSQESGMVLGFEPSLEDGSIIESRRGNLWFDIQVFGKEGHAGRDPAQSVNAAHELALKLSQLHALTDYEQEITVSTGQIGGGSKFNIICGHAHAKVDVRFSNFEHREEVHQKIKTILSTSYLEANILGELPTTAYSLANDCPPFAQSKESEIYIRKYLEILREVEGVPVGSARSGGAADANYMSRPGLIMLDGLGAKGGGVHQKSEFIHLMSLETRSEALSRFLKFLSDPIQI